MQALLQADFLHSLTTRCLSGIYFFPIVHGLAATRRGISEAEPGLTDIPHKRRLSNGNPLLAVTSGPRQNGENAAADQTLSPMAKDTRLYAGEPVEKS